MITQIANSNSSSNDIHQCDSDISFNSYYNEKSSSQHGHNSIISQPVPQVTDKFSARANAQEFFVVVDTQNNLCFSIQHDHTVHACVIEMDTATQPLEEGTSSMPITGNEPVYLLMKEIVKMKWIMEMIL